MIFDLCVGKQRNGTLIYIFYLISLLIPRSPSTAFTVSTYTIKDRLLWPICINRIEKEERSRNIEEKQLKKGRHRGQKLTREGRTCPPCSTHGRNDWKKATQTQGKQLEER